MINIQENIPLDKFTSIKLGGKAKYFCDCKSVEDIKECLSFAGEKKLKIHFLAGGSNSVFSDDGFDGIVIKIDIKGIIVQDANENDVMVKAGAGEDWDEFVKFCVDNNFAGVECLSGIPGSVGATPIQNVGAYGQEVKDTIISVKVIEKASGKTIMFPKEDCLFGYRTSRFKTVDKDKYIVTEVIFKLRKNGKPVIKYPELEKYLKSKYENNFSLQDVRNAVLELRKRKAMVIDEGDPDSVSCGSFFVNPILTNEEYEKFRRKIIDEMENGKSKIENGEELSIPHWFVNGKIKLSAAWLIENAGFKKGYIKNGVGISSKHCLALVNKGGKTSDLLELAEEIQTKVFEKFGVKLIIEPVVI